MKRVVEVLLHSVSMLVKIWFAKPREDSLVRVCPVVHVPFKPVDIDSYAARQYGIFLVS